MRTRDEVLREFLPESEWDDYDPQFVMELMASRIAQQEARIRELEGQQAASEPVAEHVTWLRYVDWPNGQTSIRVCDSDDEGAFKVYSHPSAAGVRVTDAMVEVSAVCMSDAWHEGEIAWADLNENVKTTFRTMARDSLTAALTAASDMVCSACHGEREVSEHECCGNSTNGECCGQSVEVRVPCLFCGDGTVNAASEGASA